jgi:hypothetical protein
MDDLDPTIAERILGEYPELLDHWRQEMEQPDPDDPYRIGAMRLMHDPLYRSQVVRQHRWLTEEAGGRPDEKLAPIRDERRRQLQILGSAPRWGRNAKSVPNRATAP